MSENLELTNTVCEKVERRFHNVGKAYLRSFFSETVLCSIEWESKNRVS